MTGRNGEEQCGTGSKRTDARRTVLELQDLRVRFKTRERQVYAVNGVTCSVDAGRTLAIIGESGSGKTVTSRALVGLLPPSARVSGSARLQGVELLGSSEKQMREHRGIGIGMVFQDPSRSLNPTVRIGKQVSESLRIRLGLSRSSAKQRGIELLAMVRLAAPERRYHEYPHQLSGGMRQRVMIAVALACNPKVLIADEATTALDVTTQAQILQLLSELQDTMGMALIFISHDLALAAAFADEIAVMYAGKVVERGQAKTLFDNARMPYTQSLLNARPRLEYASHQRLPVAAGQPPDMSALPVGCAFAPRCTRAQERCRTTAPDLEEGEYGHFWACWNPHRGSGG